MRSGSLTGTFHHRSELDKKKKKAFSLRRSFVDFGSPLKLYLGLSSRTKNFKREIYKLRNLLLQPDLLETKESEMEWPGAGGHRGTFVSCCWTFSEQISTSGRGPSLHSRFLHSFDLISHLPIIPSLFFSLSASSRTHKH